MFTLFTNGELDSSICLFQPELLKLSQTAQMAFPESFLLTDNELAVFDPFWESSGSTTLNDHLQELGESSPTYILTLASDMNQPTFVDGNREPESTTLKELVTPGAAAVLNAGTSEEWTKPGYSLIFPAL
jgi:hypothetical protein